MSKPTEVPDTENDNPEGLKLPVAVFGTETAQPSDFPVYEEVPNSTPAASPVAPPDNQELPPHGVNTSWNDGFQGDELQQKILETREHQLSAALNELKAKDTELAAKDARIADYEEVLADKRRLAREIDVAMHGEAEAAVQPSLCDLVGSARDLRIRAEAAEKSLCAVSEVLKEKLEMVQAAPLSGPGRSHFYQVSDVDALLTKARSIVEGK